MLLYKAISKASKQLQIVCLRDMNSSYIKTTMLTESFTTLLWILFVYSALHIKNYHTHAHFYSW